MSLQEWLFLTVPTSALVGVLMLGALPIRAPMSGWRPSGTKP